VAYLTPVHERAKFVLQFCMTAVCAGARFLMFHFFSCIMNYPYSGLVSQYVLWSTCVQQERGIAEKLHNIYGISDQLMVV
jgi:hypothetical protein